MAALRFALVLALLGCGGAEGSAGTASSTAAPSTAASSDSAPGSSAVDELETTGPAANLPAPLAEALAAHDRARAEHCAPPLAWSDELAATADAWAAELQSRGCPLEHSTNGLGENLFMATAGSRTPTEAVQVWVDERDLYDFDAGGFDMRTGHFTQVVWRETQRVGCATWVCNGMDLWVCNYDPPGNVRGGYTANVLPTSCR